MKNKEYTLQDSIDAFMDRASINAQIRFIRKSKHWTQEKLADKLGVSQKRISLLEKDGHNTTIRTLQKVAHAFGMKLVIRFVDIKK